MTKRYFYAILFSLALILGASTQASAAQNTTQQDKSQQQSSQQQQKSDQQKSEAMSQSGNKQPEANSKNEEKSAQSNSGKSAQSQKKQSHGGQFIKVQHSSQILSSSILGMSIQNGTGKKAQSIGTVNDLIMNKQHQLTGIVVGIGGFLGIGQKQVGIPWSEVKNINPKKGVAVVSVTKKQLQNAPSFTTKEEHKQKQKQKQMQQKMKQQQQKKQQQQQQQQQS